MPKIPAYNTCKRINCYCISFKFLRFRQMNFIRPKRSLENTRPRLRFYFIRGSIYKLFNLIFILNLFANKRRKKEKKYRDAERRSQLEIRQTACRTYRESDYKGEKLNLLISRAYAAHILAQNGATIDIPWKLYLQRERAYNYKLVRTLTFRKSHGS